MSTSRRIVVLLRAVNVGGHNRVPMPRLRELVADAGATEVETFIASGNLVCAPPAGGAAAFTRTVERLIADEFGVTTAVIGRTPTALRSARDAYPFPVHDPKLCWISFFAKAPGAAARRAVAGADFGADEAELIGKELHLRYTRGVQGSQLTNPKLKRLIGSEGTARNLRTVDTLIQMLG